FSSSATAMTDSMYLVSLRAIIQLPLVLDGLWDGTKQEALSGSWFLRTILGTNQQDHAQYVSTVGKTHVFFEDKGHPIAGCRVL
ncbi:MAG: hypothetical protein ABI380_10725, partial [Edaphobacter sp.]